MPETVGETIVAQLATDLTGVTETAGYTFTIENVVRELPNMADLKVALPAAFVWSGAEEYNYESALTRTVCDLSLNVIVAQRVFQDQEAVGRRMLADVTKHITKLNKIVAHTSGNVTVKVEPEGVVVWNGLSDELAGGHLVFAVRYKTAYADPYTVA